MKFTQLGEFEELVMLVIGTLEDNAYGVSIKNEIELHTKRKPSIGALHSALNRLEDKSFISSTEGGATKQRGGRRKRFYQLTSLGQKALQRTHTLRHSLYKQISGLSLEGGSNE